MNSSDEKALFNEDIEVEVNRFKRVWLFREAIDGIWVLCPIATGGFIVNSFMFYILWTKANLNTQVNTMITAECLVRVFMCSVVYLYKAWILTLSPILGLTMLPDPIHCYIGGLLSYLVGISASIFNLLTNFLRYLYVRAASIEDQAFKRFLRRPHFHYHLLFIGFVVIVIHGLSTIYVADDQFFFDQACLRPHSDLNPQTLSTKWHNILLLCYNVISISFCGMVMWRVKKEEKRLTSGPGALLKNTGQRKNRKNLYTAGTGFAHVIVMLVLLFVFILPMGIMQALEVRVTTSIQSFMMEMIGFMTHGVVSPGIIFWASSEARAPALLQIRKIRFFLSQKLAKSTGGQGAPVLIPLKDIQSNGNSGQASATESAKDD